jgi:hypothetical protein
LCVRVCGVYVYQRGLQLVDVVYSCIARLMTRGLLVYSVLLLYRVLDATDPLDIYDLCTRCRYEAIQEYEDTYRSMRRRI